MMKVDIQILEQFENLLNPAFPEKSGIPPKILGYGEISTTFCIDAMPDIAFKRMPPFDHPDQIQAYKTAVDQYFAILTEQCGIPVSAYAFYEIKNRFKEHILYVAQPRLSSESIGNFILQKNSQAKMEIMVSRITHYLLCLRQWNLNHMPHRSIALDGQISNWSFDFANPNQIQVVYFDITTPLFRIDNKEQLDTEIFLKSCPSFLVWLVRWRFLQEVLDRYYDTRAVLIDLVANFHKEKKPDLIPEALRVIHHVLEEKGLSGQIKPISRSEVDDYYKNDAFIWSLFLALRRMDRVFKTNILRKRYNFILPGKIQR